MYTLNQHYVSHAKIVASQCMHVIHSVGFRSMLVLGIHTLCEVPQRERERERDEESVDVVTLE